MLNIEFITCSKAGVDFVWVQHEFRWHRLRLGPDTGTNKFQDQIIWGRFILESGPIHIGFTSLWL